MTTRANLYVDQGIDFAIELDLLSEDGQDFEIGSQMFKCEVRKVYSSTKAFEAELDIIEDEFVNNIQLVIPAAATRGKTPGKYQYDLIMFSGTQKIKLLEGLLFLLPTVSSTE
jgi:hypothetical protein